MTAHTCAAADGSGSSTSSPPSSSSPPSPYSCCCSCRSSSSSCCSAAIGCVATRKSSTTALACLRLHGCMYAAALPALVCITWVVEGGVLSVLCRVWCHSSAGRKVMSDLGLLSDLLQSSCSAMFKQPNARVTYADTQVTIMILLELAVFCWLGAGVDAGDAHPQSRRISAHAARDRAVHSCQQILCTAYRPPSALSDCLTNTRV